METPRLDRFNTERLSYSIFVPDYYSYTHNIDINKIWLLNMKYKVPLSVVYGPVKSDFKKSVRT